MPYSTYRLDDPRDKTTRYVGMSKDPYRRLAMHMLTAGKTNLPKDRWLQELKEEGLLPTLVIIEPDIPTEAQGRKSEEYWVQKYIADGAPLTNVMNNPAAPPRIMPPRQTHTPAPSVPLSEKGRIMNIAISLGARIYQKFSQMPPYVTHPYIYRYTPGKRNHFIPLPLEELIGLPDEEIQEHLQALLKKSEEGSTSKAEITIGQVPAGYEIINRGQFLRYRWEAHYQGQPLTTPLGRPKLFADEFNATLFCWKHARQHGREVAS